MDWLALWWRDEVIAGNKGPLLLTFVAFVLTFLITRTITRLIRAGKGPFHNLSNGGVHLHHSTPGIILLVTGALTSVAANGRSPWSYAAGAAIGIGASLVLDEFAMIFHLQDVYWSQEGQLSVNVVMLCAACLGLAVVGVSPTGTAGLGDLARLRGGLTVVLLVHFALVIVTVLKGKYPTAVLSLFVGPLAVVAALRLARPTSAWARHFYSASKKARAARRAEAFDARWGPVRTRWDDFIAGRPSPPQ